VQALWFGIRNPQITQMKKMKKMKKMQIDRFFFDGFLFLLVMTAVFK